MAALITLLDAMDASAEDLEADEDCCAAREDDLDWQVSDGRAGDPDDGEAAEAEPDATAASGGDPAGGLAESCETWIGQRVDGKGARVVVRRRRVIAID